MYESVTSVGSVTPMDPVGQGGPLALVGVAGVPSVVGGHVRQVSVLRRLPRWVSDVGGADGCLRWWASNRPCRATRRAPSPRRPRMCRRSLVVCCRGKSPAGPSGPGGHGGRIARTCSHSTSEHASDIELIEPTGIFELSLANSSLLFAFATPGNTSCPRDTLWMTTAI